MKTNILKFKRGSFYSRQDIGFICYPGIGRPKGGEWDTGYTSPKGFKDNLLVFMNIGVPGKTGHNFDNKYDDKNNLVQWYGKPGSHSGTPTFKRLLNEELIPHFFARWDTKETKFLYLGIGSIIKYEDNSETEFNKGTAIKCQVLIRDADEILNYALDNDDEVKNQDRIAPQEKNISHVPESSFLYEKHLEDYIQKKWESITLSKEYDFLGRQVSTDTGPLDILAKSKDGSEYLVIELKRDMASDEVIGQTLRYMGYIKKKYCNDQQTVKGYIITNTTDLNLRNAVSMIDNIDVLTYQISFNLNKMEII